ncbi:S54 family peptidase [Alkalihalobacillus alcalophilus ATCC 27647 = CGMCC 1.3604]|uniref:Peptidase S54 n=1 Tax=Alkalihalobacillus alcalophilus ATCC 27647 = CGMCC 1.3604 TaxID=1218173 RepID=A0A094WHF5_ALKAL|nr:rhomboid family intramembrane serine protease [Alkalihalobacillus alcalophilus]KGA96221.1 peptidase S54 [Alkalihalobacillus alcalophilus ATCC 27647 = CGMCC 1.3604]MED1562999.1 rhomboid family intramembrane serine protease [Alkalihalobacillus alcalophilus]THG92316.1 S54 family peptidase [Alkalihalobacillus alcalophilus ATCC 27647 = CGMCC 1.3604]
MFIRTENFETFRMYYPVITILVAIHVLIFFWINLLPGGEWIYYHGVGLNLAVHNGDYWRLVTPIFMHVGFMHVIFNSVSLILFGPPLEQMLGKFRFILLYLSSGIIANIATYYVGGLDYYAHLGASGAIFGLFGAYFYIVLNRKDLIDQTSSQMIMTILVIGLVMTFVNPNINIYAHIFGAIGGALMIPLILIGVKPYQRYQTYTDPNEVSFNPNRWQKKSFRRFKFGKIFWVVLGVLVLLGIISRFFF